MDTPTNGDFSHIENQQKQMILMENSSGGEDQEMISRAPKKRAETWVQEETRFLITLRREVDSLFNTSKSNKHLWEKISNKMREKGFDRSPTMCTDKWRNLLKEFKKVKQQARGCDKITWLNDNKMWHYKELEELLRNRPKNASSYKSLPNPLPPTTNKIDGFIHFSSDKGIEEGNIQFGSVEANGLSNANLETPLDNNGDPLAITASEAVAGGELPPWNWREAPVDAVCDGNPSYMGRVITVKWGEHIRRIGVDGSAEAIKEAIKSAFRLRTKRAFWLEDEDNVIRSLDRDMPLCNYTLHVDEGISVKVCLYDESDGMAVRTEEKTLYTEDDLHDFLTRCGLIGLREIDGHRCLSNLDDLRTGAMYQGVRLLGD